MARVFITGSSDGLGRIAAQLLIEQGHRVVLHARNERRGEEALAAVPGGAGFPRQEGGGRKGVGHIRRRSDRQKLGDPPERERSVRPVATEVAERRKPDWPLHSEAVRRMLTVGQESKKEIPA